MFNCRDIHQRRPQNASFAIEQHYDGPLQVVRSLGTFICFISMETRHCLCKPVKVFTPRVFFYVFRCPISDGWCGGTIDFCWCVYSRFLSYKVLSSLEIQVTHHSQNGLPTPSPIWGQLPFTRGFVRVLRLCFKVNKHPIIWAVICPWTWLIRWFDLSHKGLMSLSLLALPIMQLRSEITFDRLPRDVIWPSDWWGDVIISRWCKGREHNE